MATDLLNSGMGDAGRLGFILECIEKGKPLYRTDKMYLESKNAELDEKIQRLQGNSAKSVKDIQKHPKTLLSDEDLDEILDRQDARKANNITQIKKKKSLIARIFSRK